MQEAGASARAYDPEGRKQAQKVLINVTYCEDAFQAMQGASALVTLNAWDAFRALDLARVKMLLFVLVLINLRNIYERDIVEAAGFTYESVSRL